MATTFEVLYLGTGPRIDGAEGNNLSENDTAIVGETYGSAGEPLAFGAQRTFSPVDFSGGSASHYDVDNNLANDTFSIDGGPPQTMDGLGVYNATITYTDGTPPANITATVFQDTDGNLYLAPEVSQNADYNAMIAAPIESLTLNSARDLDSGRMTADRQSTDFVCYAAGTRILTDHGEVAVETLRVGDRVISLDAGPVPINWIRRCEQPLEAVESDHRPVLIEGDALGAGRPRRALIVSPQHRILVGGRGQLCDAFPSEAFVPAKALTALRHVRHMQGRRHIAWVHFACAGHEVVRANGCWSESLLLGQMAMKAMTVSERQELRRVFPASGGIGDGLNGPPARNILGAGLARRRLLDRDGTPPSHRAA